MIVYLDDKRRPLAQAISKAQHAIAGFPLLLLGLDKLAKGEELPIAAAELVIALLVLGTFALELRAVLKHRKHGAHSHPKVGWFDLAAGALLIFEAFHGAHHKPGYLRPQFFNGLVVIALGLLHARISRRAAQRRYFQVDDTGVEVHLPPFRGWSIRWADLASITLGDKRAVFVTTTGRRHTVNLGRLHNHDAVRQALAGHPEAAKLLNA